MTVIELGEISSGTRPPAVRPVAPRDLRRILVAVVALLTLLGVTGSARPEPQSMRTLWRTPTSQEPFTLRGDTLYIQRSGRAPALEARAIADGRVLWQAPLDQPVGYVNVEVPGLVLVPATEQLADGSEQVQSIVALDAATGRERWRHRGELYAQTPDAMLLAEWSPRGGAVLRLHLARVADGTDIWSYTPTGPGAASTISPAGGTPGAPTDLIVIDRSGRVELRSLADGKVKRTGKVPWLSPEANTDSYGYAPVIGDVFFAVAVENGTMRVTAHDLATLRPLWEQFTDNGDLGGLFECGQMLCRGSEQTGIEALDPRTGVARWRSQGWSYGTMLDATRMYVESHSGAGNGIVDVRTGEVIAKFPTTMVVMDPSADRLILMAITREARPRMAVYNLEPDNSLRLAGALPQAGGDQGCQLSGRRLVCLFHRDLKAGEPPARPERSDIPFDPQDQEIVVTDVG
ncbi:PQQ-binding-like beta-propeller repeat protein [Actinoplanes sp. NBRC 103695]|uniref:outer membrane protein assembly factor BamB family protein n=1 Tax=Actinoplanes sp. NBRC 103695 TaxID=3032202 RepID=UPI0024A2E95A|nr:PQQ-binding-like beta-propeller repeat protein [Actinoplanes sp. NBRC 103695]GLY99683.1 hypothetical protein Acsp02_69360 [Actinoplanes sp. NBRC 103695]